MKFSGYLSLNKPKCCSPGGMNGGVTLTPDFSTMKAASIAKCLGEWPKYWIWQWLNNHSEKHSYHPVNDHSQNCFLNSPLILYQLCSSSGFVLLPQSPNLVLLLCAGPCYETCYTSFPDVCVPHLIFHTDYNTSYETQNESQKSQKAALSYWRPISGLSYCSFLGSKNMYQINEQKVFQIESKRCSPYLNILLSLKPSNKLHCLL